MGQRYYLVFTRTLLGTAMALTIRLFGGGKFLEETLFNGTREDAAKAAVDQIGAKNAESAEIRDDKGDLVAGVTMHER